MVYGKEIWRLTTVLVCRHGLCAAEVAVARARQCAAEADDAAEYDIWLSVAEAATRLLDMEPERRANTSTDRSRAPPPATPRRQRPA